LQVYNSKIPIIRNLFRNRVETALSYASLDDDAILLDIGCHSGFLLEAIRKHHLLSKYFGIDSSKYDRKGNMKNCYFKVADARSLPFHDKLFNVVFVLDVLEHIKEIEVVINEIHRVLKPNGLAILSGPTESRFYKMCRFLWLRKVSLESHVHTVYDIEKKFVGNGFELIELKRLPGFPIPDIFRISKLKKKRC